MCNKNKYTHKSTTKLFKMVTTIKIRKIKEKIKCVIKSNMHKKKTQ